MQDKPSYPLITLLVFTLLIFRIMLGIWTNFAHEDYIQIYLLGLENAYSGLWSYWGPEIVWSQTRLPGAMQGLLAGLPLRVTGSAYAPIIFSNLISAAGLILMAFYSKKRFPRLSIEFLLILFLLLPFCLFNGTVLLNTAYLILSGAVLFIAVAELFLYREELIFKDPSYYFLGMGMALLFTYQLHLTWVMFLPFIFVLLYFEWKRKEISLGKLLLYLGLGMMLTGVTLIPTIWTYASEMFMNSEGNLTFQPERFGRIFDLLARYFSMAIFDITQDFDVIDLAMKKSLLVKSLVWVLKAVSILHFILLALYLFRLRKSTVVQKTLLLFLLTLIMSLCLFVLGNKHLSARTYILLYPIPVWLSLYVYQELFQYDWVKKTVLTCLGLVFLTFTSIGLMNRGDIYSFEYKIDDIEKAMQERNPGAFSERRATLMDEFK